MRLEIFQLSAVFLPYILDFLDDHIHHDFLDLSHKYPVCLTVIGGMSNANILHRIQDDFELILDKIDVFDSEIIVLSFLLDNLDFLLDHGGHDSVRFFVVDCLEMRFHVGDKLLQQIIVFRE